MAATKKGAITLTESQFASELAKRLDVSESEVKKFIKGFKAEVVDCLANGYKVSFAGLVRFEPKYVSAKAKGEMVRNPGTGEMAPRKVAEPASFKAKAFASSAIAKFFPSLRTNAGKALEELLASAKSKSAVKGK